MMQGEMMSEHGVDCGVKETIETEIPNDTSSFSYRYIVENGKLVCLTPEVFPKYVGKKVKMRSPEFCKGEHLCTICGGEMPYKLHLTNIGLSCNKIATTLVNLGMKKFHSSAIKTYEIKPDEVFI